MTLDRLSIDEMAADPWRLFEVIASADTYGAGLDGLGAIHEVEDLLVAYTDRYDAKELEGILARFTEDAVLVTPAGRFEGADGVRSFYAPQVTLARFILHRLAATTVRLGADSNNAWLASYYSSYSVQAPENSWSQNGRYVGRAVKQDGVWRLAEFLIAVDYTKTFVAQPVTA